MISEAGGQLSHDESPKWKWAVVRSYTFASADSRVFIRLKAGVF